MKPAATAKVKKPKAGAVVASDPSGTIANWYALGLRIEELGRSGLEGDAALLARLRELSRKNECLVPRNFNSTHLGKVRRIAENFTADEIRWMSDLIRTRGSSFGTAHLIRSLAVTSARKRIALIRNAIENSLPLRQFDTRVQVTHKVRRANVGRKPHVPDDFKSVVTELERMTVKWLRWTERAKGKFDRKLLTRVESADRAVLAVQQALPEFLSR